MAELRLTRDGQTLARASVAVSQPSGAKVYMAPGGNDSNPGTYSSPVRTLQRAYLRASPGDTVEMAGGSYGSGSLSYDPAKIGAGARVVFRPALGAAVSFGGITVSGAQHFEIHDISAPGWIFCTARDKDGGGPRFSDALFENVTCNIFFVRTALDVTYRGGQIGPSHDSSSPTIGSYPGLPPSENVVIDGTHFYDVDRRDAPGGHLEGLFVQESDGTQVLNCHFEQCEVMDLYVNAIFGGRVTNMLVQNTRFEATSPSGYYSCDSGAWPVRYVGNSFGQSIIAQGASGCGNRRDSSSVTVPAALLQPCPS